MKPLRTLKEIQSLNGKVAILGRFILKVGECCHSFFQVIKKLKSFVWTPKYQTTFKDLKKLMASSLLLFSPRKNKVLFLYLLVIEYTVSVVLVWEEVRLQKLHIILAMVLSDQKVRFCFSSSR